MSEKISAMPSLTPTGTELVPIVSSGSNYSCTTQQIANLVATPNFNDICPAIVGCNNIYTGTVGVSFGYQNNTTSAYSGFTCIGYNNRDSGRSNTSCGYNNTTAGAYSVAVGYRCNPGSTGNSIAIGMGATCSGNQATSIGMFTSCSGNFGICMGYTATCSSYAGVCLNGNASGNRSVAVGSAASASNNYSTAVGFNVNSSGGKTVAIGCNNTASSYGAMAIGGQNTSSGSYATASGYNNSVSGDCAIGIGLGNNATQRSDIAIGTNNTSSGYQCYSLGVGNNVSGNNSGAFGLNNTISGNYSYAVGFNNNVMGNSSAAFGTGNTVSGNSSIVIGNGKTMTSSGYTVVGGLGHLQFPDLAYNFLTADPFGNITTAIPIPTNVFNTQSGVVNPTLVSGTFNPQATTEYEVSMYVDLVTAGNPADTITFTFQWHDGDATRSIEFPAFDLHGGTMQYNVATVHATASSVFAYSNTLVTITGSPTVNAYINIVQIR